MIPFMLCAGSFGVGLGWLVRLAWPPAPALTREIATWQGRRADRPASHDRPRRWAPAVRELTRRFPTTAQALRQDAAACGVDLEPWLIRSVALALVCVPVPLLLLPVLSLLGVPASAAGLLLTLGAGAGAGLLLVVRHDLAAKAEARRAEFRRGLSLYLDLVVMSVEAGRGHGEALPAAAHVGSGWVFAELQTAVSSARVFGISTWRALGEVGERLGLPELTDLEATMGLAQDEGGRVRESLAARAQTLRDARAADVQARATQDTDAMRNTLVLMSLLAAAYVITARLLFLFTA